MPDRSFTPAPTCTRRLFAKQVRAEAYFLPPSPLPAQPGGGANIRYHFPDRTLVVAEVPNGPTCILLPHHPAQTLGRLIMTYTLEQLCHLHSTADYNGP